MKLYAISDLHLDHRANREALAYMPDHADDWLILAGDICATAEQLDSALQLFTDKFARVIWVPGNHELWLNPKEEHTSSVAKYEQLVEVCRANGVASPEDDYLYWPGEGGEHIIAPLHLLYDYSFRPDHVDVDMAVDWAVESGVLCQDEMRIKPAPFESKSHWCAARLDYTQARLAALPADIPLILVNHFPLRYDLVRTMRIPRFSIWCGTKATENWHRQYPVKVAVSGHLHMRATDYRHGVRYEEVSLGYPRDWRPEHGIASYLREILPGPDTQYHHAGPFWRF